MLIINIKTCNKLKTKMEAQIFLQTPQDISKHYENESRTPLDNQYSIEVFLNLDAFVNDCQHKEQGLTSVSPVISGKQPERPLSQNHLEPISASKKKSIFHNFQKHLISLLKRFINIREPSLKNYSNIQLISHLWITFVRSKTFNKRILQTVFGCACKNSSLYEPSLIFKQFRDFRYIFSKYSGQDILQAQKRIREIVVCQLRNLSKNMLAEKTNISRLDDFFAYFSNFMGQIEHGFMSKRMPKTCKPTPVQRTSGKKSNS